MFTSLLMALGDQSMELQAKRDVHDYNTRNRDMLRLFLSTRNWENRVCYHYLKDWNNLDKEIRNAPGIVNFMRSIFSSFFYLMLFCVLIAAFYQILI